MIEFSGIDSLFADKLYALVKEEKATVVENVASARGVSDFASYQRLVGEIAAFDKVLAMFDTVTHRIADEGRRK